jgi:tRNA G18 (ribose-2'-O)-methylase SpoU
MRQIAVILSDIRSTYNVGSILRSADCFGISHVFYAGITPYPLMKNDNRLPHLAGKLTRAIHKTALGAENNLESSVYKSTPDAIRFARAKGYKIACLEQSDKSISLSGYPPPSKLAIILGNEVAGLSIQTLESSDVILEIPMLGKKESLNVSVAASIALYVLRFKDKM